MVVRPDGVLVPVRNYQTLGTLEWHGPRLDVYANVGGEYEDRTAFVSGGKGVGYGSTLFNNSGCDTETPPALTTTTVATPIDRDSSHGRHRQHSSSRSGGYASDRRVQSRRDYRTATETRAASLKARIGFWYRFYNGPKGRVQWGPQYSYIVATLGPAVGGNPKRRRICSSRRSATTCRNTQLLAFAEMVPCGGGDFLSIVNLRGFCTGVDARAYTRKIRLWAG